MILNLLNRKKSFVSLMIFFTLYNINSPIAAQDIRAQIPGLFSNSYFGVNVSHIHHAFTNTHLKEGYFAERVQIPKAGVKIILFGHEFNNHLSAQITYMRPVDWVSYFNVNGSNQYHTVWTNIGGLTVKSKLPLIRDKFFVNSEVGLGLITLNGFKINDVYIVDDAVFASMLLSAGVQFRLNKRWELLFDATWIPGDRLRRQPATKVFSAGFNHIMRPWEPEKLKRNSDPRFIFPHKMLQLGFSTNALGYGVNKFFADGAIPLFWGGTVAVKNGITVHYQQNIFHSRKVFSLDWGISFGYWNSDREKEKFITLSVFPVFRFTLIHTRPADFYFYYSVAGPAYISKSVIDSTVTGRRFTFQDLMGIGMFSGKKRKLNTDIRIGHYSNGNIFPDNKGIKIPLTFSLGYTY